MALPELRADVDGVSDAANPPQTRLVYCFDVAVRLAVVSPVMGAVMLTFVAAVAMVITVVVPIVVSAAVVVTHIRRDGGLDFGCL